MGRFLREIVVTGFVFFLGFLAKTIFGVEIEEYWNGAVQPFLEAHSWAWVASMLSFIPTFWGGVVTTLVALLAVHQLTGLYMARRASRSDPIVEIAAAKSNLVQSVAPDGITFQIFPYQDGIDVAMIVTITNPTKALTHVKIFGWDCEIGGHKPRDRTGVGISTPLLPGRKERIRLARVRIKQFGSDVSGWAQMAIAFGDDRAVPSTVATFRYEFGFDDYGHLVPGETKVSDYLNFRLTDLGYQPATDFKKDEVTALRSQ